MRHDEAQARMTFEYARDPRRTIVRVFVPRNVTDVREHEAFALRDAREHRIEARIVDRQTLHVFVYFQADAAVVNAASRSPAGSGSSRCTVASGTP